MKVLILITRGVFKEFIQFLTSNGDSILAVHLKNSPHNAMYLSPEIRNEMVSITGESIKSYIVKEVIECGPFSILMDETSDLSYKEQVSNFVRYVKFGNQNYTICEHIIALQETNQTTGEALTELILYILSKNNLLVENLVGRGYDGESNMRGAIKGVQSRIKEINPNALYTHCFSHNLNLVLINSLTGSRHTTLKHFFGTVELIYSFIEGSPVRHSYFISKQKCPLRYTNDNTTCLHFTNCSGE
jgi:hypothetical protein